jgi:predicted PurR-regulated permease PerM
MNFPPPTVKQARVLWFTLTVVAVAVLVALAGLMVWGVGHVIGRLSTVLLPIAFALILAYILDPVVEFFVRKRVPRFWSVCLVFAFAGLLVAIVIGSILPGLNRESRKLARDLPKNLDTLHARAEHFMETSPLFRMLPADWREQLDGLTPDATNRVAMEGTNLAPGIALSVDTNVVTFTDTNFLADSGTNQVFSGTTMAPLNGIIFHSFERAILVVVKWFTAQLSKVTTWVEFFIGFVLVPVYLFYFLLEKEPITKHWKQYVPIKESAAKEEAIFILQEANECLIVFFRGQVLVALCVGGLLTVGYLAMGLNYAALLGLVACTLGIVPYLGTITSLLLALAVAGVQFGDGKHIVLVLAIAGMVKLAEDFIISPRIIGERAGLHPLTIILAVMFGTTLLGGFLGALLAIPLTAVLRTLMYRYIWQRAVANRRAARAGR